MILITILIGLLFCKALPIIIKTYNIEWDVFRDYCWAVSSYIMLGRLRDYLIADNTVSHYLSFAAYGLYYFIDCMTYYVAIEPSQEEKERAEDVQRQLELHQSWAPTGASADPSGINPVEWYQNQKRMLQATLYQNYQADTKAWADGKVDRGLVDGVLLLIIAILP